MTGTLALIGLVSAVLVCMVVVCIGAAMASSRGRGGARVAWLVSAWVAARGLLVVALMEAWGVL